MSSGQISGRHQKLVDDLTPHKLEITFKQLDPLIFRSRMVHIQPTLERTVFLSQLQDTASVFDRGIDLEFVANDA